MHCPAMSTAQLIAVLTALVCAMPGGQSTATDGLSPESANESYANYVAGLFATSGLHWNKMAKHLLPMRVPHSQRPNVDLESASVTIDTLLSVLQLFEYQDVLNKAVSDNSSTFLSTMKMTVNWLAEDARNWMNALMKLSSSPATCGDWDSQDFNQCDQECIRRMIRRLRLMQIVYQPANNAYNLDFPVSYDVENGFPRAVVWISNLTAQGAVGSFLSCVD